MAGSSGEAVKKIVIINTRYVKTDPMSFKSVVQSFTGKDSCVAWVDDGTIMGERRREAPTAVHGRAERPLCAGVGGSGSVGDGALGAASHHHHHYLSFEVLDWLLPEMPTIMEELQWQLAE
ncbi:VQ motif-containing protein 10-like [Malania oleifera]|uniref:VQ motif-containing protein 10-like n=1 Tax=Malania oleifera TaxID=397392 RepID=UPI0025AEBE7D|nr:VQ motif-containing protein 10-like [Malania oleifera]